MSVNGPTGTLLGSTTITTTQSGYIMSIAVATFTDSTTNDNVVNMYLTEAGTTSSVTQHSILRRQPGGAVGYASITVIQRTSVPAAGPYTVSVYAYLSSAPTGGSVLCTHLDIGALGNLG
jgi:hypothetical protein